MEESPKQLSEIAKDHRPIAVLMKIAPFDSSRTVQVKTIRETLKDVVGWYMWTTLLCPEHVMQKIEVTFLVFLSWYCMCAL